MSFNSMYDSVKRSIKRYGTDGILGIKTASGSIDFDTGKAEDSLTPIKVRGVISKFTDSQIIDGVINIDDLKLTVQIDTQAKKGDIVAFGRTNYAVMNVSEQIRHGKIIKTTLQLRETFEQMTSECLLSIGGVDGDLFKMDGIWSQDCIMFKST